MISNESKAVLIFIVGVIAGTVLHVDARTQSVTLSEPESLGIFYQRDESTGSLLRLERQSSQVREHLAGFLKVTVAVQLKGEKAALRIKANQKQEFVVQLANGVDPGKYKLVSFVVKKGKRELVIAKATLLGEKDSTGTLAFDVTKYGKASYKVVPSEPLRQGEYGFSANDSSEVFCFGIDAQ